MVYSPPNMHYAHVNVDDVPHEVLESIMGYKGSYFKAFTDIMKLKYVWWNMETKVIELWGPFNRLQEARAAMVQRVNTELKLVPDVSLNAH